MLDGVSIAIEREFANQVQGNCKAAWPCAMAPHLSHVSQILQILSNFEDLMGIAKVRTARFSNLSATTNQPLSLAGRQHGARELK